MVRGFLRLAGRITLSAAAALILLLFLGLSSGEGKGMVSMTSLGRQAGQIFDLFAGNEAKILDKLQNSLILLLPTLLISLAAALGAAIWSVSSGKKNRGIFERAALHLSAIPPFLYGTLFIFLFGIWVPDFLAAHFGIRAGLPFAGMHSDRLAENCGGLVRFRDLIRHMTLPMITLGIGQFLMLFSLYSALFRELSREVFFKCAIARGADIRSVCVNHGIPYLRPMLLSTAGMAFPAMLNMGLLVEILFSWPGLGRFGYQAFIARDYIGLAATVVLFALLCGVFMGMAEALAQKSPGRGSSSGQDAVL